MLLSKPLKEAPAENTAYKESTGIKKQFDTSWETKSSGREKAKQTFIELLVIKRRKECCR